MAACQVLKHLLFRAQHPLPVGSRAMRECQGGGRLRCCPPTDALPNPGPVEEKAAVLQLGAGWAMAGPAVPLGAPVSNGSSHHPPLNKGHAAKQVGRRAAHA